MPFAVSSSIPCNGVFSPANIVTLRIAITTCFAAPPLPKPQNVALEGMMCSPAPTVTPRTALTWAGVTSAQESVGGAAQDGRTHISSNRKKPAIATLTLTFRFIREPPFEHRLNHFPSTTSTRRLSALPLAVALSATGLVAPNPSGANRDTSTPCCFSQATTDLARASESG